jgi:hypothetical protein
MITQISVSTGMRDIEGCLRVGPSDRTTLERLIADGKTPQKIVKRALIVRDTAHRQSPCQSVATW